MKIAPTCAFSAVVACLMAQSHTVYGSSFLRSEANKKERKLNGYYQDTYHDPYYQDPYYYPLPAFPEPRPTERPTPRPTPNPTNRPTPMPSPAPTHRPTPRPTPNPTPMPTRKPTLHPTRHPTLHPTPHPTRHPTKKPTEHPTDHPTPYPTREPTTHPSAFPTRAPSQEPSPAPSPEPSPAPSVSMSPTRTAPSAEPSENPTQSEEPSENPTQSSEPSDNPTQSEEPSENPTQSEEPSENPTQSSEPSSQPTGDLLTIAEIICLPENVNIYGDFCAAIVAAGFGPPLNNFDTLLRRENLNLVAWLRDNTFGRAAIPAERAERIADYTNRALSVPDVEIVVVDPPGDIEIILDIQSFEELNKFFEDNYNEFYLMNPYANFDNYKDYNRFLRAFRNAQDVEQFFTVFAPTNDAMRSINFDIVAFMNLEENVRVDFLTEIVGYHVIAGQVLTYNELTCGSFYEMSNGMHSLTECRGGFRKYQVGRGNIELDYECVIDEVNTDCQGNYPLIQRPRNIVASNGIIHSVNNVLIPFLFPTPAPSQSPTN